MQSLSKCASFTPFLKLPQEVRLLVEMARFGAQDIWLQRVETTWTWRYTSGRLVTLARVFSDGPRGDPTSIVASGRLAQRPEWVESGHWSPRLSASHALEYYWFARKRPKLSKPARYTPADAAAPNPISPIQTRRSAMLISLRV
jgi:hypothetical protein